MLDHCVRRTSGTVLLLSSFQLGVESVEARAIAPELEYPRPERFGRRKCSRRKAYELIAVQADQLRGNLGEKHSTRITRELDRRALR